MYISFSPVSSVSPPGCLVVLASFLSLSLSVSSPCRILTKTPTSAQTHAGAGSECSFSAETERLISSLVGSKNTASDPHISHWPCLPNTLSVSHSMHHQFFIVVSLLRLT